MKLDLSKLDRDDLLKVYDFIQKLLSDKAIISSPIVESSIIEPSVIPSNITTVPIKRKGPIASGKIQDVGSGAIKENQCVTQAIDTSSPRVNIFDASQFERPSERKKNLAIDQKLAGNNELTQKGNTRLVKLTCSRCKKKFDVSPKLAYNSGGGVEFICDNCQANARK